MRFIIYGVGAIGGTFAAALSLAGHEVVGIARGGMLDAIRSSGGLMFRTAADAQLVSFPVVGAPDELEFQPDDVIFLTMKGQHTALALEELRAAGVTTQAVVCAQNGVNNERLTLRLFPNVYAMTVMLPADYVTPGEVICYGTPKYGMVDLGRYPHGLDETVAAIATAFDSAGLAAFPLEQVMRSKYGKLRDNLGNVLEAALGHGSRTGPLLEAIQAEAEAVYAAAAIDWVAVGNADPRRQGLMEMGAVAGVTRTGGSSIQSLKRGAGTIETDYLNGEIVLLGRLHGVPTPLNAGLVTIGHELVAKGAKPGSMSEAELRARLGL
ncbi:MAG TPA: 2-dehydropantoate 2-reductase N-terminal domain-containing protein [Devosia sp.]|jgi:2-dehydropantoate 2-reductase|uniref:ketopantoate reductase family protein n=1 Tax=Devosia sp. TaxID=1871048 RepID=UPI002DDCE50A|nr:2-dehydropantoate 2-reductase N-terminal domain-containing protein [Devosia sp.]HEV2517642.1 2-dehydropantoate 2-reductase N-terminal domain-containing protein [Devosia sp.]